MVNTLVSPEDLIDFPGAPFEWMLVDIAAASVRAEARWHIAPVLTETLIVDSWGGTDLFVPSKRIVSVTATRSAGLTLDFTASAPGVLYRPQGWPVGTVEIDLTHGYAKTPLDLLPLIADRVRNLGNPRDPSVTSRQVGQVQEAYGNIGVAATVDPRLAPYRIIEGVA